MWSIVVPVKPATIGKSRLTVPGIDRTALARAIALDTIDAAAGAQRVAEVVVVTDDPGIRAALACPAPQPSGAPEADGVPSQRSGTGRAPAGQSVDTDSPPARITIVSDPGRGLDAAIAAGLVTGSTLARRDVVASANDRPSGDGSSRRGRLHAAMLGDLPSLRPSDLDEALTRAAEQTTDAVHPEELDPAARAAPRIRPLVVADADGTGTTLLAHAHPGILRFGPGSYRRHLTAGAARLDLPPDSTLRHDVDTAEHLATARAIGLGPRTTALLSKAPTAGEGRGPDEP